MLKGQRQRKVGMNKRSVKEENLCKALKVRQICLFSLLHCLGFERYDSWMYYKKGRSKVASTNTNPQRLYKVGPSLILEL